MSIDPEHLEESLSHARHELRSPMNAIQGYASLLLDETRKNGQTEYEPALRKILSSTQHMLNLISLLLGEPPKERPPGATGFDVNELIGQIEQMFHGIFPDRLLSTERDLDDASVWVAGNESELASTITDVLIEVADRSSGRLTFRVARHAAAAFRVTILAEEVSADTRLDDVRKTVAEHERTLDRRIDVQLSKQQIRIQIDLELPPESEADTVPSVDEETSTVEADFSGLTLPATVWLAINEAAGMHSVTEVRKQIKLVEDLGPDYQSVTERLLDQCQRYDMVGILDTIQSIDKA